MRQTAEENKSVFCLSRIQGKTDPVACENLKADSSERTVVSGTLAPDVRQSGLDVSERDLQSVEHRLGAVPLQENSASHFSQVQENKPVAESLHENYFADSTKSVEKKMSHSSQPNKGKKHILISYLKLTGAAVEKV